MLCLCLLLPFVLLAAASPGVERCNSLLERGDFNAADAEARALLKANPNSAVARVLLARAHIGMNDAAGALLELRKALRIDPKNIDALYYVVKLTGVLSQMELTEMAKLDPDSARVHQVKAEALSSLGDAQGAETEYREALARRPNTPQIMSALGDLQREQRKYNEALEWYGKVLERNPGHYDALYGAGACQLSLNDAERAVPLLRRALQADPGSMAAKMALGQALLDNGEVARALPLLEAAAQADPSFRRVQFLLSRAYKAVGRTQDARKALDRYRALPSPEDDEERQ